jgi:hypothetical protein
MLHAHIPVQEDDYILCLLNRCCYPKCKTIDPVAPPLTMSVKSCLLHRTAQAILQRQIEMLMKEFQLQDSTDSNDITFFANGCK